MTLELVSSAKSFGGQQNVYRHASRETRTDMVVGVYLPPQAEAEDPLPVLYYLSGLTCTHANVTDKGGFQRVCAELGLIFVAPDTSPRGPDVPDDPGYDFGQGAGFYVDASEALFAANYRMYSYITGELPSLLEEHLPIDPARQAITGHSMGGHGALTIALRNPGRYLGTDRAAWRKHDSVALIEDGHRLNEILIDQGTSDNFLEEQLKPDLLETACRDAGIPLTLRMQHGYDHSYFFISTFMEDHLRWHAERLER